MSPESERAAEAREWLGKAALDLRGAQIDLAATPPLLEDALFHAQQVVEKSLKAFLVWRDMAFRKPLGGRVVRPALGVDALHAGTLDAKLFEKEPDLALLTCDAGAEADALVEVMLRPYPREGEGEGDVSHRGGVDDRGSGESRPAIG